MKPKYTIESSLYNDDTLFITYLTFKGQRFAVKFLDDCILLSRYSGNSLRQNTAVYHSADVDVSPFGYSGIDCLNVTRSFLAKPLMQESSSRDVRVLNSSNIGNFLGAGPRYSCELFSLLTADLVNYRKNANDMILSRLQK